MPARDVIRRVDLRAGRRGAGQRGGETKSTSVRVGVNKRARARDKLRDHARGRQLDGARARSRDGRSRRVRATGEGVGDAAVALNAGALLRARPHCASYRRRLGAPRREFGTSRDAPVRHTPGTTARSPRGRTPALSLTSSSRRPRSCGRSTVACAALSGVRGSVGIRRKKVRWKKCAFRGGRGRFADKSSIRSRSVSTEPRNKSSIGG